MTSSLPDGFGRAFRRCVFARTSTMRSRTLAWVLVDAAYAYGSRRVTLGHQLLRRETGLSGWSLEHARNELVDAGLLLVNSSGQGRGARTVWTLRWTENVRSWADIVGKRPPKRPPERPPERPPVGGHEFEFEFDYPLSPPKGGQEGNHKEDLTEAVRPRRRDRRTNAEVIADAIARLEARDAEAQQGADE